MTNGEKGGSFYVFDEFTDSGVKDASAKGASSVRIETVGYRIVIRSVVMLVDPEKKKKKKIDTLKQKKISM